MSFYQLMASKYANRRTFSPESETGSAGGAGEAGAEGAANADAAAAADAGAVDEAGQGSDAGQRKADEALKTEAGKTDDEKAALLREVMEKKDKLKATSKDLADAKRALEAYEGVDPAKVKELIRKEAEAEQRDAEARGDFERVKQMMAEEHERAVAKIQNDLKAERESRAADIALIDELTIGNAFGNSDFIRESMSISPTKVRSLYGSHFERKDGVVVAYDKPAGAKDRTMLVDATGAALSFEEALSRIIDADPDKKGMMKSRAKPGAGSANDADKSKKDKPALSGAKLIAANLASLDD